jgi:hypothetical protein
LRLPFGNRVEVLLEVAHNLPTIPPPATHPLIQSNVILNAVKNLRLLLRVCTAGILPNCPPHTRDVENANIPYLNALSS